MAQEKAEVVSGNAPHQHSIIVAILGLDERSHQVLAGALHKRSGGLCVIEDARPPQVALIDLDSSDLKRLLEEFRKSHPGVRLIGLGQQQAKVSVDTIIAKPIKLELLLATILELSGHGAQQGKNMITNDKVARAMQALENKNIARSLRSRAEKSQTKSAAKREMPSKTDELCFNPDRFLLGSILAAMKQSRENNQTAALTAWSDRTIFIDPHHGTIISNLNENQIRSLAIAPLDDNLSSPIHTEFYSSGKVDRVLDAVLRGKNMRRFSQEAFLWDLGLLTCRGRIPVEFTVCNLYYLRRWPNLTRMRVPANAMRILAFWNLQPCSLADIKEQLDIPYQDIFCVASAAYAAGLIGEARRKSDQIMQTIEVNEHKKRGLMNSIIGRLRSNKSKSTTGPT